MLPKPFAELEAQARERYRQKFASVPAPRVLNVVELVAFISTAPRAFEMGGVGYRAPPLSFPSGLRLYTAANALRDLRTRGASGVDLQQAARGALPLVVQAIAPTLRLRLGWRRRLRQLRQTLLADPRELENLLWFLTYVPDEAPSVPPTTVVTIDYQDQFAGFCREMAAWVGPDGLPLSWAHYQVGLRHQGRARAREDLRSSIATRFAGADLKSFRDYDGELRAVAGW